MLEYYYRQLYQAGKRYDMIGSIPTDSTNSSDYDGWLVILLPGTLIISLMIAWCIRMYQQEKNHAKIIELFKQWTPESNLVIKPRYNDIYTNPPLILAIISGNLGLVEHILDNQDLLQYNCNRQKETALHYAVYYYDEHVNARVEILERIIDHTNDLSSDNYGINPLHSAATISRKTKNYSLIRRLVQEKKYRPFQLIPTADYHRMTFLHLLSMRSVSLRNDREQYFFLDDLTEVREFVESVKDEISPGIFSCENTQGLTLRSLQPIVSPIQSSTASKDEVPSWFGEKLGEKLGERLGERLEEHSSSSQSTSDN